MYRSKSFVLCACILLVPGVAQAKPRRSSRLIKKRVVPSLFLSQKTLSKKIEQLEKGLQHVKGYIQRPLGQDVIDNRLHGLAHIAIKKAKLPEQEVSLGVVGHYAKIWLGQTAQQTKNKVIKVAHEFLTRPGWQSGDIVRAACQQKEVVQGRLQHLYAGIPETNIKARALEVKDLLKVGTLYLGEKTKDGAFYLGAKAKTGAFYLGAKAKGGMEIAGSHVKDRMLKMAHALFFRPDWQPSDVVWPALIKSAQMRDNLQKLYAEIPRENIRATIKHGYGIAQKVTAQSSRYLQNVAQVAVATSTKWHGAAKNRASVIYGETTAGAKKQIQRVANAARFAVTRPDWQQRDVMRVALEDLDKKTKNIQSMYAAVHNMDSYEPLYALGRGVSTAMSYAEQGVENVILPLAQNSANYASEIVAASAQGWSNIIDTTLQTLADTKGNGKRQVSNMYAALPKDNINVYLGAVQSGVDQMISYVKGQPAQKYGSWHPRDVIRVGLVEQYKAKRRVMSVYKSMPKVAITELTSGIEKVIGSVVWKVSSTCDAVMHSLSPCKDWAPHYVTRSATYKLAMQGHASGARVKQLYAVVPKENLNVYARAAQDGITQLASCVGWGCPRQENYAQWYPRNVVRMALVKQHETKRRLMNSYKSVPQVDVQNIVSCAQRGVGCLADGAKEVTQQVAHDIAAYGGKTKQRLQNMYAAMPDAIYGSRSKQRLQNMYAAMPNAMQQVKDIKDSAVQLLSPAGWHPRNVVRMALIKQYRIKKQTIPSMQESIASAIDVASGHISRTAERIATHTALPNDIVSCAFDRLYSMMPKHVVAQASDEDVEFVLPPAPKPVGLTQLMPILDEEFDHAPSRRHLRRRKQKVIQARRIKGPRMLQEKEEWLDDEIESFEDDAHFSLVPTEVAYSLVHDTPAQAEEEILLTDHHTPAQAEEEILLADNETPVLEEIEQQIAEHDIEPAPEQDPEAIEKVAEAQTDEQESIDEGFVRLTKDRAKVLVATRKSDKKQQRPKRRRASVKLDEKSEGSLGEIGNKLQESLMVTNKLLGNMLETYEKRPAFIPRRSIGTSIEVVADASGDERFAALLPFHYLWADQSFNDCGMKTSLSNFIFGCPFQIKDIFLLSKLADDDKLHIVPPAEQNKPFGDARNEQYLALLASTNVNIDADLREFIFNLGGIYRFGENRIKGAIGATLPIKSRTHLMDFSFSGGQLFTAGENPSNIDAINNTLARFFNDFTDICDFFRRGILEPKGLTFDCRQNRVGVGDLQLFVTGDFQDYFEHVDGWQVGFTWIFPTANKQDATKIWEVELGNSGAVQLDLFSNIVISSSSNLFNPALVFGGEFSIPFTSCQRVPKCKSQEEEGLLADNPDILLPVFKEYRSDPFKEFDSSVLYFADQAIKTRISYGSRFFFGLGNYFYNVFRESFRLGIWYNFFTKSKDKVRIKDSCATGVFNTCLLEERTKSTSHSLSWNLTYKFNNLFELNLGSQHVVGGRNMVKYNEFFASAIIVFE